MQFTLILGANKTGTSTVTAIGNAHPKCHLLYEVDFAASIDQSRNQEFTAAFPNTKHLFSSGYSVRNQLSEVLRLNAHLFDQYPLAFGTKVPGLAVERFEANANIPIIFTLRDIRTWICKNAIITGFQEKRSDRNIVPLIVDYCLFLLASFKHDRVLRLRLEDIHLEGGTYWPRCISSFLGLDLVEIEHWWEKRSEIWERTKYSSWAAYHDSSFVRPEALDTVSSVRPHFAWDAILPIFDKYFKAPSARFSHSDIEADMKTLNMISAQCVMTMAEAFADFKSWSFKANLKSLEVR